MNDIFYNFPLLFSICKDKRISKNLLFLIINRIIFISIEKLSNFYVNFERSFYSFQCIIEFSIFFSVITYL